MRRLLIVDDDEAILRLFRLNLSEDYEIIGTDDPEQALALAMEHKPDAILLDLRMPKFSGFDLHRTFQSFSQTQLIPIFVVSGQVGIEMKNACDALGAAGFFEKPIDFDVVKARLVTVKRQTIVPRSEVRVQIRVPIKLRGMDMDGKEFEEITPTENVSLSGFFCGCESPLKKDTIVEVYFARDAREFAGRARCVRLESRETGPPQYAFRFVEKTGKWILQ